MVANCIIVHGSLVRDKRGDKDYIPESEGNWIGWLKKRLEDIGIRSYNPQMPESWKPKYEEWKKEFEKLEVNEDTILIGHSAGGAFLVRWLGGTGKKVKKLILVAAAKTFDEEHKRLKELSDFNINSNIKNNVGEVIIFVSDNDIDIIKESAKIYEKALNAKLIEFHGKGHFSLGDLGTEEFPELLEEVLK